MKYLFLAFFVLATMPVTSGFADNVGDNIKWADKAALDIDSFARQIKRLSWRLEHSEYDGEDLALWTKLTIKASGAASLCVANVEASLSELKSDMEGLGKAVEGETADVTVKRENYKKRQAELEKKLAKCNLVKLSSNEASSLITEAEKSYFEQKYLRRQQDVVMLAFNYLKNPVALISDSGQFLWQKSGIREIELKEAVFSSLFVLTVFVFSLWLRKSLREIESRHQWYDDFTNNFIRALLTTGANSLPYILVSSAIAASLIVITHATGNWPFLTQLSIGLVAYFSAYAAIRLVFAPHPPARMCFSFTPEIAASLSRRLQVLALLGLIGYLAFYTVFSENIDENSLLLLRVVFSTVFVLNIIWTLAVIIRSPKLPKLRWVSYVVIVALIVTLVAEMAGYRNLAIAARQMVIFSFVLFVVFIGIAKLFRDVFNKIDSGEYGWGQRLHNNLGITHGEKIPGLIWLRLLTTILVWGSFSLLLINAWDYSGGIIENIRNYLVNGFDVGNVRIIPGRIFWAVLIFSLIVILSSWIRSQMENKWLKMTGMNSGARDALVTITGYVLFLFAALAGLSAAGFDFGNIAIVAGALSVGIGFGLQNIVNNFVSGLILLFERPVRKGDWIVVGGTEGVVKDIQIRSTRIQTFDRADVIVPNSELISNQVTNWVLSSDSGRAIIPVGVAYGSDTAQVRDILLSVAEQNKAVASSSHLPKPVVLFREFGDSSLNFELRVFLHKVDSRLGVISDLNFAIDQAFREANIEIPFPQRDVNVKNLPDTFSEEK